jgi:hypothetical protein
MQLSGAGALSRRARAMNGYHAEVLLLIVALALLYWIIKPV